MNLDDTRSEQLMDQGLSGNVAGKQSGVSYTSLDSQTMAAANAAAQAAGLSLEEWLSRTILENARRSGIIPGQASGGAPATPVNAATCAVRRQPPTRPASRLPSG